MRSRRVLSSIAGMALVAMLVPAGSVTAANKKPKAAAGPEFVTVDSERLGKLPVKGVSKADLRKLDRLNNKLAKKKKGKGYKVGDKRYWLALDDVEGSYYPKKFKLRGKRNNIEVWVAADKDDISNGTWYPEGDCRNDYPDRIKPTNQQINYFTKEFDTHMLPVLSDTFSVAPKRDGSGHLMSVFFPDLGIKKNDYKAKGSGRRVVTLVDNVRDDQFYDMNDSQDLGRIGGFFSSTLNEVFNRNVMTIDSWNWVYGLGENPPNDPVPGDVCASATASPFGYEGTFGHEYQHLLEYYEDIDEASFVNEGLSVFAEDLLGYSEPAAPMTDARWDAFMQCLYGNFDVPSDFNPNPKDVGGPENSLTLWGDQDHQNSDEIFCDYGAGGSFIQMLVQQFGADAATLMHTADGNGLAGVQELLTAEGSAKTPLDLVHQWAAMIALDGVIDAGATLTGGTAADYQVDALNGIIYWVDDDAYSEPGAPPNGADFVQARDGAGAFLNAGAIDSIDFMGAAELASVPTEWVVDATGHDGDPALYSTEGVEEFDSAIAREVTVPADNATLTFDAKFDTEFQWDFGFVQVSDDGGETWTSLANETTRSDHVPDAYPTVVSNVPGYTGESGVAEDQQTADPEAAAWVAQSFDLTDYAGETIHLAFRYITDWGYQDPEGGFWVDNVMVGDTAVSDGTDLDQWQSFTQVNPVDVEGFTVQLVGYNTAMTEAFVGQLPLDENFSGSLSGAELDAIIGTTADLVGILVTYDESTELVTQYAPYELMVNGVLQPGGA